MQLSTIMVNLVVLVLLFKELISTIKMPCQLQILKDFKKHLLNFIDELISQFPQEGDLVILRVFIDNQVQIKNIMDGFIFKINTNDNQLRNMISKRNEMFFIEHDVFTSVGNVNPDKIRYFKKIWLSGSLDNDDKQIIWEWIDLFVHLSNQYVKLN
jgi:hypothetical protein